MFSLNGPVRSSRRGVVSTKGRLLTGKTSIVVLSYLKFRRHRHSLLRGRLSIPILLSGMLVTQLTTRLLIWFYIATDTSNPCDRMSIRLPSETDLYFGMVDAFPTG